VMEGRKLHPYDGNTSGEIALPASILPGMYQLVAYTTYQRNSGDQSIFRKKIQVVSGLKESGGVDAPDDVIPGSTPVDPVAPKINLRFFPEGGDCVVGIPCRVAIIAEGPDGGARSISGTLKRKDGLAIKTFSTESTGISTIEYRPLGGEEIQLDQGATNAVFPLPIPLANGFHLSVYERNDTVSITLQTNAPMGLAGASMLVHLRGIGLLDRQFNGRKNKARFLLPTKDLPEGVITATIFDPEGQPVAERLFFVAPRKSDLEVSILDSTYLMRSSVEVSLRMPQADVLLDSLRGGRISLSVLPLSSTGGPAGDDIRSWLLLNSDLDRPVPAAPELLFGDLVDDRSRKIEDYLLTRGWRRFRWRDLVDFKDEPPAYPLELGVYLRGQMTKIDERNAPRPGKVFLSRLENAYTEERVTDEDGNFAFGPYTIEGNLPVSVQGRFKWGKRNRNNPKISLEDNNNVFLKVKELESPSLPVVLSPTPGQLIDPATAPAAAPIAASDYEEASRKSLTVARTYDSLIIDLQVVDVVTKRINEVEEARDARANLYGTPDDRIVLDSVAGAYAARNVLDLLRTVPGVSITGNNEDAKVSIRGINSFDLSTEPAYFIDGNPATLEQLLILPIEVIEFIDVLKGATASAFGSIGANGVILVYTRSGDFSVDKEPGLLNATIRGYHKVRQFAIFDADAPANRGRADLRTTIHWNPILRTEADGTAKESFTTSDQTGRFLIIAQGLRKDGRPFVGTQTFRVGSGD
ncbi:MAG: TonB-dependent receptor plug domain-containing protein, partial [Bacteroidota bacterium]